MCRSVGYWQLISFAGGTPTQGCALATGRAMKGGANPNDFEAAPLINGPLDAHLQVEQSGSLVLETLIAVQEGTVLYLDAWERCHR